jgi:starvation-inducible DNA-binding protein
MRATDAKSCRSAALHTPTDLTSNAAQDVAAALNLLLADTFALLSQDEEFPLTRVRAAFPRLHLLRDEQRDEIFATTDALAERARKIGGATLRPSASLLESWIDEAERRDDAPGS